MEVSEGVLTTTVVTGVFLNKVRETISTKMFAIKGRNNRGHGLTPQISASSVSIFNRDYHLQLEHACLPFRQRTPRSAHHVANLRVEAAPLDPTIGINTVDFGRHHMCSLDYGVSLTRLPRAEMNTLALIPARIGLPCSSRRCRSAGG